MDDSVLARYLKEHSEDFTPEMVSYVSKLEVMSKIAPDIAKSVVRELDVQRSRLKLVASENYSSLAVQMAMGNLLTDKYAEGYPKHRYYAGCENVDAVEETAASEAQLLFGADYAYVQPHSGADANLIAYWAILDAKVIGPKFKALKEERPGVKTYDDLFESEWEYIRHDASKQKLLSLDYGSGSHLTHGYRQNVSAQMFECYHYSVNEEGLLNYQAIEEQAMEVKPLILLAGYSAYLRKINFKRFREIADKCGAVLMVDMAHFAGLVAGKVFTDEYDPVKWADIVTTTTHKTLRGPRGGMILCKEWLKDSVSRGCPMVMGGPLPHVMAAKAIALREASTLEFREYARHIVENSQALAEALMSEGIKVHTDGTENHIVMIDVSKSGLTGRQAENALFECGIVSNRNALPNDPNGPWYASGIRLGTAALTTLGMGTDEMREIGKMIALVLKNTVRIKTSKSSYHLNEEVKDEVLARVKALLDKFVLYPELDLKFLKENFCGII